MTTIQKMTDSILEHWRPTLAKLFAQGRGDAIEANPERFIAHAAADDRELAGLLVVLATRLDDLCIPSGDPDLARHAIGLDSKAAELTARIVRRLNECQKPIRLRETQEPRPSLA